LLYAKLQRLSEEVLHKELARVGKYWEIQTAETFGKIKYKKKTDNNKLWCMVSIMYELHALYVHTIQLNCVDNAIPLLNILTLCHLQTDWVILKKKNISYIGSHFSHSQFSLARACTRDRKYRFGKLVAYDVTRHI
jgi:hypothetical protein